MGARAFHQLRARRGSAPHIARRQTAVWRSPVTSLDNWSPKTGQEAQHARDLLLKDVLLRLRDKVWRANVIGAARVGRSGDPDSDLAEVMGSDGRS